MISETFYVFFNGLYLGFFSVIFFHNVHEI